MICAFLVGFYACAIPTFPINIYGMFFYSLVRVRDRSLVAVDEDVTKARHACGKEH